MSYIWKFTFIGILQTKSGSAPILIVPVLQSLIRRAHFQMIRLNRYPCPKRLRELQLNWTLMVNKSKGRITVTLLNRMQNQSNQAPTNSSGLEQFGWADNWNNQTRGFTQQTKQSSSSGDDYWDTIISVCKNLPEISISTKPSFSLIVCRLNC